MLVSDGFCTVSGLTSGGSSRAGVETDERSWGVLAAEAVFGVA